MQNTEQATMPCIAELRTPRGGVHYAQAMLAPKSRRVDLVHHHMVELSFGPYREMTVVAVQTHFPERRFIASPPKMIALAVRNAFPHR